MKKIDTYYGEMVADLPEHDFIYQSLSEYGEWGLLECYFASTILEPGYVAVDIGAFIGTFSLGLSRFGARKIISVEPNSLVLPSLKQNLDKNSHVPFAVVEAAAGKRDDRHWTLSVEHENLGGTHLVESHGASDKMVKIIPLSEIRKQYGNYDFLKIDAEGHETDIIESDKNYINEKAKIVFFEENSDSSHQTAIKFLLESGFYLYLCAFPAFNKNNYNSSKKRLFNIACESNVLASRFPVTMCDELKALGCFMWEFKSTKEFNHIRSYIPRWGRTEWEDLDKIELLALLSKAVIQLNNPNADSGQLTEVKA